MLLRDYLILLLCFHRLSRAKILERKKKLECTTPSVPSLQKPCYCDSRCDFYNDCCNRYADKRRRATTVYDCKLAREMDIQYHGIGDNAIMVVDRCPVDTTDVVLRRRCETMTIKDGFVFGVPVIDSHRVFKNRFCAKCNTYKFFSPIVEIGCYKNITKKIESDRSQAISLVQKRKCHLSVTLPPNSYRICTANRYLKPKCKWRPNSLNIQQCWTAPTYYTMCKQNMYAVYRNIYCARCSLYPRKCTPVSLKALSNFPRTKFWGAYRYDFLFDLINFDRENLHLQPRIPISNSTSLVQSDFPNSSYDIERTWDNETGNMSASTSSPEDGIPLIEVLSIAGGCLSLLSLLFLIVTYAILPSLRGFGSQIVLALAVTLATALTCFLLGPILKTILPCSAIAIVTHMVYLSSFVWMSLLATDLYRSFSSSRGVHRNKKRHFLRFAVIGWGIPMLVTTAAVLVDFLAPRLVICPKFGKGNGVRCYLHSKLGLVVWIYAPVSICVVVNIILSTCLFKVLWRTSNETREVHSPQRKREMAFLCLKITSIVGLTWSFSLVAAWSKNMLVTGISGLINSLQGFFLAIAFLGSPRVVRAMSLGISDFTSSRDRD